tara:strand:+ start:1463 stop:2161 length:699 start_codon:yes stop_codon:yes gene_type:complete
MHILLTRPLEDCYDMITRFKSLGHEISHLPLIVINELNHEEINYQEFNGIIFTSSNAIKFLKIKNVDKKKICFCVGNSTEKKARSVGFQNIISADGNVDNLKELILQVYPIIKGKLLYVSGDIVTKNLDEELISLGYSVKRIINYTTKRNEKIDNNFIEKLKLQMPELVYIYSQNSAMSLLNIIKKHNIENLWMDTNLMCISEKTSSILNEIKWKKIFLFNPGEEEFLLYKI